MNNLQPIFDSKLIKQNEYDVDVIRYIDGLPKNEIKKMIIQPIELGSKIEFKKKSDSGSIFTIDMNQKVEIRGTVEEKGLLKKKEYFIEIESNNENGNKNNIKFKIDEEFFSQIKTDMENQSVLNKSYWDSVNIQYNTGGMVSSIPLYYKVPFLSQNEELLWINTNTEGVIHKHLKWISALTNFRALIYDFQKHSYGVILMSEVDDVLVMNQRRLSESAGTGYYSGAGRFGTFSSTRSGTSRTVGDVVFMKAGQKVITWGGVVDPSGIAKLAKSVKKELFTPPKKSLVKKEITKSSPTIKKNKDDPLTVLKLRLVKGEITKEQYEELKKTIGSD